MAGSAWANREQRILDAIAEARESGEILSTAARQAVPDLPDRLYRETIASLEGAGYIEALVDRGGDGEVFLGMVIGLTERGLRAAGVWPSDDPLVAFEEAIAEQLATTQDPEERSRLQKLKDTIGGMGKAAATGVITEALKRAAGL